MLGRRWWMLRCRDTRAGTKSRAHCWQFEMCVQCVWCVAFDSGLLNMNTSPWQKSAELNKLSEHIFDAAMDPCLLQRHHITKNAK
jgi:hypothetical protein